ncbi:MAG: hypothetical protein QW291_01485 [Thermofilaceae archaeon]
MKESASLLIALIVLSTATAVPKVQFNEVEIITSGSGAITVRYLTLNITCQVALWGPNWSWDNNYSLQINWPVQSVKDREVSGRLNSPWGTFTWREEALFGSDFALYEFTLTTDSDLTFENIAWIIDLPIENFASGSITVLLSDGTLQNVKLRAEYVSGEEELASYDNGFGWIVPIGQNLGVTMAVFTDTAAQVPLSVTDEREWGGTTYRLRFYYPGGRQVLKAGDAIKFYVYIHPYSSAEGYEAMVQRVHGLAYLRGGGTSSRELKDLLAASKLESTIEQMRRERQTLLILYVVAALALVFTLVLFLKRRHR